MYSYLYAPYPPIIGCPGAGVGAGGGGGAGAAHLQSDRVKLVLMHATWTGDPSAAAHWKTPLQPCTYTVLLPLHPNVLPYTHAAWDVCLTNDTSQVLLGDGGGCKIIAVVAAGTAAAKRTAKRWQVGMFNQYGKKKNRDVLK